MRSVIFIAALLALACSPEASGQPRRCSDRLEAAKRGEQVRPLLVLLESDPWAMVIGSDSPRFVLYDDGVAIYRAKDGFKTAKLSQDEIGEFQQALQVDALACLVGKYEASDATDQPTESIFIGRGGKLAQISVYGVPASSGVPVEIASAYDKLVKFDHSDARPWIPEKVEVMIWSYEYAPEASIIWPKKWPSFDGSDVVKRGDSYSIFIPAAEYPELVKFLQTRKEKGAVEIGGKKWAADIRFPFPEEDRWMGLGD